MRRIFLLLIGLVTFSAHSQTGDPDHGKNYSILIQATADAQNEEIVLNWNAFVSASSYLVNRKEANSRDWGTALMQSSSMSYTDTDVEKGKRYEYRVVALNSSNNALAFGYSYSGLEAEPIEKQGRIAVVVEQTVSSDLELEINRLEKDLLAEGWIPEVIIYHKDSSVTGLKSILEEEHNSSELSSIFLIGNVPVPYSGDKAYDAHGNHEGAWVADMYYGEFDADWTDNTINNTSPSRNVNKNVPGDGKFDQTILFNLGSLDIEVGSLIDVPVGRVDMSDLPAFSETEIELLKQYLDKDHAYRTGEQDLNEKAVIEDNFNFQSEGFSQTGWRNFSVAVGQNNVLNADPLSSIRNDHHLFVYGSGAGSYTSCGGVGRTSDFVNDSMQATFMFLFGSYFGDWDSRDNILRASLANRGGILTNAWAGRPVWNTHHMATGLPIGLSLLNTQNNIGTSLGESGTYVSFAFAGGTHVSLLGDPSLRLYPLKPATEFEVSANLSANEADLSWTASSEPGVIGYHVYRWVGENEGFTRINDEIINSTSYTDQYPFSDTQAYMVRAVELKTNPSGSFYNLSSGQIDTAIGLEANFPASAKEADLIAAVYPNPAREIVNVDLTRHSNSGDLRLIDANGKIIFEKNIEGQQREQIDLSSLVPGVYSIQVSNGESLSTNTLVIH